MTLRNSIFYQFAIFILLSGSGICFADSFSYFDGRIDYWSASAAKTAAEVKPESKKGEMNDASDIKENQKPFEWQKYMDPKHKEFFKEGDYVPPEPFMEVARDPSDYNVKMWFAYIEKKNALATRLQQRLGEYATKSGEAPPVLAPVIAEKPPQVAATTPDDVKRYQFRMYFDSQCPHCQKMMRTMSELSQRGFSVEAKQIDELPFSAGNVPFTVSKASRSEVAQHHISSVPFILVADLQKKVVYKMSGYKSIDALWGEINGGQKH